MLRSSTWPWFPAVGTLIILTFIVYLCLLLLVSPQYPDTEDAFAELIPHQKDVQWPILEVSRSVLYS